MSTHWEDVEPDMLSEGDRIRWECHDGTMSTGVVADVYYELHTWNICTDNGRVYAGFLRGREVQDGDENDVDPPASKEVGRSDQRSFGSRIEGECVDAGGFVVPWLVEARYSHERPGALAVEVMSRRGPAMCTDVATVFLSESELEQIIDMLVEQRKKLRVEQKARMLHDDAIVG